MADQTAVVSPHHDRDDDDDLSSIIDHLLQSHESNDTSLDFIDRMITFDGPDHHHHHDDVIPWDPLVDGSKNDVALDVDREDSKLLVRESTVDFGATTSSKGRDHDHHVDHDDHDVDHDDDDDDDQVEEENGILPLQVGPTKNPYPCACCQVLREIIHTNGTHTTKLEIHGRMGVISHAILENHYISIDGVAPAIRDYQMVDFYRQCLENVNEYIKQHLEDHRQKGYTLLQDPLSFFYEVLCNGFDWVGIINWNDPALHTNYSTGEQHDAQFNHGGTSHMDNMGVPHQAMDPPETTNNNNQGPLTDLAIQRKRIKDLNLCDFAKYFDNPIEAAAKKLRLCSTVIKRKLRLYHIDRWPYRKVKSIKRRIVEWSKDLGAEDIQVKLQAQIEINKLELRLTKILNGDIETLKNI